MYIKNSNGPSVPECCLEEFHSLLCTIVNKCHLLLPVVYDYTESLESKVATRIAKWCRITRQRVLLIVRKTDLCHRRFARDPSNCTDSATYELTEPEFEPKP